jgi:hypothetical protein
MRKAIAVLLLFTAALAAADVTGTWTGSLSFKREDGSEGSDTAYLVLKQEGSAVTGTAGGNPGDQHAVSDGKVEGDQFTFRIVRERGEMQISLKVSPSGREMTGEVRRGVGGEARTAKLALTKSE